MLSVSIAPIFPHDCSKCQFLGTHEHDGRKADLYVCPTDMPELICRFGEEGDYGSFPLDACLRIEAANGHPFYDEILKRLRALKML